MPFGMVSGGNRQWLMDLLKSLSGTAREKIEMGRPISSTSQYLTGQQPNEVAILRDKMEMNRRWPPTARGGASSVFPPGQVKDDLVDMAARYDPGGNRLPQRNYSPGGGLIKAMQGKPVTTGIGRANEAMSSPAAQIEAFQRRAQNPSQPALMETDLGPSPNEPGIPDSEPQAEPMGDAALLESALKHPDLLRQAEGGQMGSLELLKALLERRNQEPRDIGGPG